MFKTEKNEKYAEMLTAFTNNNFAEASEETLRKQVNAGGANVLNPGDVVEWPDDMKLLENTALQNALVMIVKVTNNKGVERYMPFYPSSLNKSTCVVSVDTDGNVTGEEYVDAKGNASEAYQKYRNLEQGEAILKFAQDHPNGFKVTDRKSVKTYGFDSVNRCRDTNRLVNTNIYTFDLV